MEDIRIYKGVKPSEKIIYSNLKWFTEEYYTIEDDGGCLTIKKCYMEIPKKARKFNRKVKQLTNVVINIPEGIYKPDKESNEDELVIYYK